MSVTDPGSESHPLGELPGAKAEDRPETVQPPGVRAGTAGQDETVAYIPKDGPSPSGAGADRGAPRGSYQFLDAPRAADEIGWLAHYRVRRCIGEGGMGLVFEAEDTDLLRPVALKVIRPELAGSPEATQRFTLEARAMAALKHDHIVTIYQVGQQRGVAFLAMEYLQGMSLSRWLDRGNKASLDLVLRLGRETAAGLAAAHKRGLIHRDIKPANIWLEAPNGRVKILDFGLARSERHDSHITHPGVTLGTPAYMAPEQACGDDVDASSDLFSLGCVLYQLGTGLLPFSGPTIMAVLTSLSTKTPSPPRELNPALPAALDALVMQLLSKEPANRPASAEVVVKAIKGIERALLAERQQAELSTATPRPAVVGLGKPAPAGIAGAPSAPDPVAKRGSRHRTIWIVAVVLGTATAAAVCGLVFAPARKTTRGIVAKQALLVPVHDERAGGPTANTSPEDARRTQPEAGPDQLRVGDHRGVVPATSSPPLEKVREVTAAVSPGQPPRVRPGPRDRQGSLASLAGDPPLAAGVRDEVQREVQRPARKISEETRLQGERTRETRHREDWRDPTDPDGDCQFDLDRREHKIRIVVPGTPHLLSAELGRMNAPRILREVIGDFDASVRVAGAFHPAGSRTVKEYAPYHGAGILLWQDGDNYVRLEIAADLQHGKVRPYVNFEYRKDGALAESRGLKIGDGASHLRLRRRGDEISAAFSRDGVIWTSFTPLSAKLEQRLSVGVAAINTATKPVTAELEGFDVSERPGTSARVNAGVVNPWPPRTFD
ncbi:MAG: protein kinase [Isosphaerales bacterium]